MIRHLGSILWILTYVLIAVGGFRTKDENRVLMPLISGALNFAWEINALITSGGFWVHIAWLALDCIILFQNIRILFNNKKNGLIYIYILFVIVSIVLLYLLFNTATAFDGMLISSYALDFLISLEYLLCIKKISPYWLTLIGVCRFLGDLFTWIVYINSAMFVTIIGVIIFITNLFYIFYSIELTNYRNKRKESKYRA